MYDDATYDYCAIIRVKSTLVLLPTCLGDASCMYLCASRYYLFSPTHPHLVKEDNDISAAVQSQILEVKKTKPIENPKSQNVGQSRTRRE